ncbi:hypothetical protein [Deinococcus aerophilus]|uniref:Uncharacterized protein n=1 Tax=Deinococcus aerophilus TaxID=522488 RepID=A0ABQ2GK46_9DEIO|nr:hypothetical protein [Deinococcus aerophilus]GGM00384.1 hypothetical protein GCM10010841_06230 [Deinococcus aerophilus]
MFQTLSEWVSATAVTLSGRYGVNPVVFGLLYFGSMPLFALSLAWWLRRWRGGGSTTLPALTTGLLFVGAYLYVLVAGRNLPLWVYVFMGAMLLLGAVTTWRQVQAKRAPSDR